jgi:hypothetical protein
MCSGDKTEAPRLKNGAEASQGPPDAHPLFDLRKAASLASKRGRAVASKCTCAERLGQAPRPPSGDGRHEEA